MHCNWLNNLASGPSVTKVQEQTFQQDANGVFIPSNSKLDFAPTDTCVKAGAFTISNAAPTFFNGNRTVSTHERRCCVIRPDETWVWVEADV
ncbi:MAG: hypothetical protein AAB116_05830, partial [Candidatus Poribacteria bacterium]